MGLYERFISEVFEGEAMMDGDEVTDYVILRVACVVDGVENARRSGQEEEHKGHKQDNVSRNDKERNGVGVFWRI